MTRARIAVTGVGVVSALGADQSSTFSALMAGERGIAPVTLFDVGGQRSRLAAEVRGLSPSDVAPRGQGSEWSRSDALAVLAAREALASAVSEVVTELGASKLKDLGRCMSALKERYPGLIETGEAGKAVRKALSSAR